LADKANDGCGWIGAGAAKLLATVYELELLLFDYQHNAVGVLRDGVDLLNLLIFCGHRVDESVKVLIGLVILIRGSKVCLPATAGCLPTGIWHVTFYELELLRLLPRWPIWSGMQEASK
jgi:hypothetical protein